MTKAELVEKVSEQIHLTKKETERVVNIVFGCVVDALRQDDKVELRGFGSFRVRHREPRNGRNPKSGTTVQIPAKKVPFFKAGKELRELVNVVPESFSRDSAGVPQ
ncbi:MAG: HU family DNA-binding protein [Nitrospinota bacterium]